MVVGTHAGTLQVDEQGTLNNCGTVPCSNKAMTNVLSLGEMTDCCRATFHSAVDNAFHVHLPNRVIRFPCNERKIYAHKPAPKALPPSGCRPPVTRNPQDEDDDPPMPTVFAQTVEENKLFCTPREVDRAKQAQDLLAALGSPAQLPDLKAALS